MACILTRMGKKREAIEALSKAFEEEDYLAEGVSDEEDLKPLAEMPEFIELMKSYEIKDEQPGSEQAVEP